MQDTFDIIWRSSNTWHAGVQFVTRNITCNIVNDQWLKGWSIINYGQCDEGHKFYSCQDLRFFFVPGMTSRHDIINEFLNCCVIVQDKTGHSSVTEETTGTY